MVTEEEEEKKKKKKEKEEELEGSVHMIWRRNRISFNLFISKDTSQQRGKPLYLSLSLSHF